jgi:hypothetical protein
MCNSSADCAWAGGTAEEDLEECREGLRVRIRKSKMDQEGVGATAAVPWQLQTSR